ncbi:MAG: SDR family oxidoreductase [Bdellovibrionales bacterium]|nr:SDR family oxidoreductase [Bdellovibrionales bacterium]
MDLGIQGRGALVMESTEEMGDLTAFLYSDRAGYVTGQAIAADGGVLKGI